jgi:hypothetical protein
MSVVEGGTFDPLDVATGPGRFLIAPNTAPVPTDPYGAMSATGNAQGFYPAIAPWRDTGLSVDAPSYTHAKESEGLEFQQVKGTLFDRITEVTRTITAQVSGINASNLSLIENVPPANVTEIVASAGKPAATKVEFGRYSRLLSYRGILMFERADDTAPVTEPGGKTRPPALYLILPLMQLSADEDAEFEIASGEAVNVAVSFKVLPTPGSARGKDHGMWYLEKPGTFVAA